MPQAMIMPKKYFFDANGEPLAFGKVYTYQTGTTNDKETFTTEVGDVANTNPVILNGEGYASIYLDGSYSIVVDDANDVNIWTADPVSSNIAEEWVGCEIPIYISTTSFKITDNVTSLYEPGRRVRIDNDVPTLVYSTIVSSSFGAGETTIVITDAVVAAGIIGVCASIIGVNSRPKNLMLNYDTLADAIADIGNLVIGDVLILKERTVGDGGGATWDAVDATTVTEDEYGIVTGDGTISLVLRTSGTINAKQFGMISDDPGDGTGTNSIGALQAAINAGAGSRIILPFIDGDQYVRLNNVSPISVPADTTIEFHGAKLYQEVGGADKTDSLFRVQNDNVIFQGFGEILFTGTKITNGTGESVCAMIRFDNDAGAANEPLLNPKVKGAIRMVSPCTTAVQLVNCVDGYVKVISDGELSLGEWTPGVDTQYHGVYIVDSHACKVDDSLISNYMSCVKLSQFSTLTTQYGTLLGNYANKVVHSSLLAYRDHGVYSGGSYNKVEHCKVISRQDPSVNSHSPIILNGEGEEANYNYIETSGQGPRSRKPIKNKWTHNTLKHVDPDIGTAESGFRGFNLNPLTAGDDILDNDVTHNYIYAEADVIGKQAIRLEAELNGRISGNDVSHNHIIGKYFSGSTNYSINDEGILIAHSATVANFGYDNTANHNHVDTVGNRAMRAREMKDSQFIGNVFRNAKTRGLHLEGVEDSIIDNLTISHDGTTDTGTTARGYESVAAVLLSGGNNTIGNCKFNENVTDEYFALSSGDRITDNAGLKDYGVLGANAEWKVSDGATVIADPTTASGYRISQTPILGVPDGHKVTVVNENATYTFIFGTTGRSQTIGTSSTVNLVWYNGGWELA